MNKIFYLSTCSTCQRIMKDMPLGKFETHDIKTELLKDSDLDQMRALTKSYDQLFSRRALKYRSLGLNKQQLSEQDYKHWILKEYTFLKRPVTIIGQSIFIGSSKNTVEQLQQALLQL